MNGMECLGKSGEHDSTGGAGTPYEPNGTRAARSESSPHPCGHGVSGRALVVLFRRIGEVRSGWFPEEAALVEGAAECRRREFAAARGLAHEAMEKLGVAAAPVLRSERAPRWPEGVTGALGHASGRKGQDGWAAAVVGRADAVRGIGIDLEWAGRVGERLWSRVFNEAERRALEAMPEGEWQTLSAGIGFSAKEAFYKLFQPLTGRWADFHDATVTARKDGGFTLECAAELPGIPSRLEGRWMRPAPGEAPDLVLCLLALSVDGTSLLPDFPASFSVP